MSTLDRYIARQYLFNVVALLVLLFSFVVAVDVGLNVDRFVSTVERSYAVGGVPPAGLRKLVLVALAVFELWWPRLLQLFTYLVGIALVGAMGFTLTQLVRHREMVAMLAGGISLRRVLRPILAVALAMMALKLLNQELILASPRIAPLLARDHGDVGSGRSWSDFTVYPAADGQGRVIYAKRFDPERGVLEGLYVWRRDENRVATHLITADRAVWREGGWDLENPRVESLQLSRSGTPVGDRREPAPARIETDLTPAALLFNHYVAFAQSLSWRQISGMLDSPRLTPGMRERLERVRWGRVSNTLSTLLALVIAVPFFALREPRNMLVQSLKCAPVGILTLMGAVLGSSIEWPGLPATLSVFLPVLVLAPLAVAVVWSMRT